MQPKRYIVWSKSNIDLDDPFQKKMVYPAGLNQRQGGRRGLHRLG